MMEPYVLTIKHKVTTIREGAEWIRLHNLLPGSVETIERGLAEAIVTHGAIVDPDGTTIEGV